jgi:hypothetical protein
MTKSPPLENWNDYDLFKEAVVKSHKMMFPDKDVRVLDTRPGAFPCVAVADTTFKVEGAIYIGFMFVYTMDFEKIRDHGEWIDKLPNKIY